VKTPRTPRALLRRLLLPAAVVVAAGALGLLAWSPLPATNAGAPANAVLTAATTGTGSRPAARSGVSLATGKTLFDQTCSSCHGSNAQGSALAPNLLGLGAGTIDLWVSSGWMPLTQPGAQPLRKANRYTNAQTIDIAEYVASLSNNKGFPIPSSGFTSLKGTSQAKGLAVFAEICAACHTITGAGDALSGGIVAPSLHDVTRRQIVEAVRTGPGNMPRFGSGILTDAQVRNVMAYVVQDIQHPTNPGGISLGGVGPVAEGFVGLFVGVGACVLFAYWIGDRTPRGPEGAEQHGDGHGGGGSDGGDGGPRGDGGDGREREVENA
jgi:ubiquinol-cytochrome c reductase cytochrome c subunit